jgi:F-type H+-transporting ATPase subunit b
MSEARHIKKYIFLVLFFIAFSLFLFNLAVAEENQHSNSEKAVQTNVEDTNHETSGHGEDRSADLTDLLYRFINFTALVIILFFLIRKSKLMDQLSIRSEEIKQRLSDLEKEREEAESMCHEAEMKLMDLKTKRQEIIDQYIKEGQTEKDKIISEANEKVSHIIEQSELTIQQEIESARDGLKQEIVELAAQRAQEIIAKVMNEKDHDNLINEFIERVRKTN